MEGAVRSQGPLVPLTVAALAVLVAPACNKRRPEPAETAPATETAPAAETGPAEAAPRVPSGPPVGPTGTIRGTVKVTGKTPEMPLLERGADPVCARVEMRAQTILVGPGGGLENALVRIEPGAVPRWLPSTPIVVDQVDCMYKPRVQGAVRGQSLVIRNSDRTFHNVNGRRGAWADRRDTETLFNMGQAAGSPELRQPIGDADVLKLRCDVHGWMQGFVVVSDNPYFWTTGADGAFAIERAPAGTYDVQVWHEYYGVKSQKVTVKEGETVAVDFTYDAEKDRPAQAGAPPR